MVPVATIFICFFTLAVAAPQGVRPDVETAPPELVVRLAVHVQKTADGARLVFNLEESPEEAESPIRPKVDPILSIGKNFQIKQSPENDKKSSQAQRKIQIAAPKQVFISNTTDKRNSSSSELSGVEPKHDFFRDKHEGPAPKQSSDIVFKALDESVNKTNSKQGQAVSISTAYHSARRKVDTGSPQRLEFKISLGDMPKNSGRTGLVKMNEGSAIRKVSTLRPVTKTTIGLMPTSDSFQKYGATKPNSLAVHSTTERTKNSELPESAGRGGLMGDQNIVPKPSERLKDQLNNLESSKITTTERNTAKFSQTTESILGLAQQNSGKLGTTQQPFYVSNGVSNVVPTGDDYDYMSDEDSQVNKAVADQGFGVLASRCSSYDPGLVSDGAGGCTKPARFRKKHLGVRFKAAGANEIHSDAKPTSDSSRVEDRMEVINLHDL